METAAHGRAGPSPLCSAHDCPEHLNPLHLQSGLDRADLGYTPGGGTRTLPRGQMLRNGFKHFWYLVNRAWKIAACPQAEVGRPLRMGFTFLRGCKEKEKTKKQRKSRAVHN